MSGLYPDVTEQAVIKALGDFLTSIVDCPVLRSQVNRVAMPVGDVIYMTPLTRTALSVSVDKFVAPNMNISRSTQIDVQIDCYGAQSGDRAQTIATLLRDGYAANAMPANVQPLYAGDPRQLPLVDGEEQYVERWTFEAALQIAPVVTVPQDSATSIVVGLVNVDAKYPPA